MIFINKHFWQCNLTQTSGSKDRWSENLTDSVCRPKYGRQGAPVTNVRNIFRVSWEEAIRNSVRKPSTLFSSLSIEVGNVRRLTTASLVRDDPLKTKSSSKSTGYLFIFSRKPKQDKPSLSWSSAVFVLPIASWKSMACITEVLFSFYRDREKGTMKNTINKT